MNRSGPFRDILRLSIGDLVAKTLNFVAYVYLARLVGVADFGALEFARAVLLYFLLLADSGLEQWAIREAARGADLRVLVSRVVPLRLVLALGAFGALLAVLPLFPSGALLRTLTVLFGLTLFSQAIGLKWVYMSQSRMTRVAGGLVAAQILFALSIFGAVREPERVVWVPVFQLAADLAMAAYFAWLYSRDYGSLRFPFTLRGARSAMSSALPLGLSTGLALMNFNFDMILLGFLAGSVAVGLYGAAYKPITAVMAMPVTFFLGIFPALSRAFAEGEAEFRALVERSLRLTSLLAMPLGVCGTFLAEPVIHTLFGPAYRDAVAPLRILSWAAILVVIRGTFRQALMAANRSRLDLRCAAMSTSLNVVLNLILIPSYGIVGAAAATTASELVWLGAAIYFFERYVAKVSVPRLIWRPVIASVAMAGCFWIAQSLPWLIGTLAAGMTYCIALMLMRAKEMRVLVARLAHSLRAE